MNAQDYPLPEVIGEFYPNPEGPFFGQKFAWAGDQNGDGIDDLLVVNDPGHRIDLFYGGENMSEEYDFAFLPLRENIENFEGFHFLGHLLPDRHVCIATWGFQRGASKVYIDIFEGGNRLGDEPLFTKIVAWGNEFISSEQSRRPVDLNGDGFDDFFSVSQGIPNGKLQIFYGGENYDTIPDCEISYFDPREYIGGYDYSTGYDVNGDGFGDILIQGLAINQELQAEMYFHEMIPGGSPMDTIPAFRIWESDFPSQDPRGGHVRMRNGFSLLPDLNGDFYDDWGIWWYANWDGGFDDGIFIFFGGEEINADPDLHLEGHRRLWVQEGHLTGGDFNGDGYGDVAAVYWNGNPRMGELQYHFGGCWMDGEADIYINSEREYDGRYFVMGPKIGAVGDYNGDEVDDVVVRTIAGGPRLVIFAGNRDWDVGVESDEVPRAYDLALQAYPNPFNGKTKFEFTIPQTSDVTLSIYDLNGRLVKTIVNRQLASGNHHRFWTYDTNGIFFAKITVGQQREIRKVVCLR